MSRPNSRGKLSLFSIVVALAIVGCQQLQKSQEPTTKNPPKPRRTASGDVVTRPNVASSNEGHLLLGNPSNAGADDDNFLLEKSQFVLSYNRSKGGPNWVAWHTDASDLGETKRTNNFRPDPTLPTSWQITTAEYKGIGFDRGHVCPSGDRTNSQKDNSATFLMSNMLPQTAALNQHVWADLENYLRDQIEAGHEVYQIAGPTKEASRIGDGKVAVPQACWKIAVILPVGKRDLNRINAQTRVVAVGMPNVEDSQLANGDWKQYRVPVSKLEKATKLDFLSALPDDVERALESQTDVGN